MFKYELLNQLQPVESRNKLFFFKAYHLQTFTTGWRVIGSDTVLRWLALAHLKATRLDCRPGVFSTCCLHVLPRCECECGRLFVSSVTPSIHRWLVRGVAPTAGAWHQLLRQPQRSRSSVTGWMDRGAYHSAEKNSRTGVMDGNHGIRGEICRKHPAVCLIRITNNLHGLGYAKQAQHLEL